MIRHAKLFEYKMLALHCPEVVPSLGLTDSPTNFRRIFGYAFVEEDDDAFGLAHTSKHLSHILPGD